MLPHLQAVTRLPYSHVMRGLILLSHLTMYSVLVNTLALYLYTTMFDLVIFGSTQLTIVYLPR